MFSGKTVLNCIKVSKNEALNGIYDCGKRLFGDSSVTFVFHSIDL